jgi:uncharacterized repeat protein (TIGR01451 family)
MRGTQETKGWKAGSRSGASAVVLVLALGVSQTIGAMVATADPPPNTQVCAGEKYNVDELPVTTVDGIHIELKDPETVLFDLPEGVESAVVCVKAGSAQQDEGPQNYTITEDTEINTGGKDVSHVSIVSVTFETPEPGIDVEKTCPTGTKTVGDTITYSITVTNTGEEDLENVVVSDSLLGGTLAGFSSTLAEGAHQTLSFVYTIKAGDPDPLTNTVTASGDGVESEKHVSATDGCSVDTTPTTGGGGGGAPPPPPPPPGEIAVDIVKTNDADGDGTYTNSEEALEPGSNVSFLLVITNTSDEVVTITSLTDAFPGSSIDLLANKCSALAGVSLDPGESVDCTFSIQDYSPDATADPKINTATVCVENANGTQEACDDNDSRVTSAEVLGGTITRGPTRTPPAGLAFTGPSSGSTNWIIVAFLLLLIGTTLMYLGSPPEEELEG